MEGPSQPLSREPRSPLVRPGDNPLAMVLMSLTILVLGILVIYIQCRQLSTQIRTMVRNRDEANQRRVYAKYSQRYRKQSKEKEAPRAVAEIKQAQKELKERQDQSFQEMSAQLTHMRGMQRDVKAKLSTLQDLVEKKTRAVEQKGSPKNKKKD